MKNLLTENEIRNMMKYANMNKLADGFVTRVNEEYMADDEEMDMPPEAAEADMAPSPEADMADEPAAEEPPAGDVDVEALVRDLAAVIEQHTGADIEVEDAAADDMPADDMPADDMPADDMPADDMPADDMPEDEELDEQADPNASALEEEETLEEVVNMIASRVAKRILTEQ